jgi:phospholipid transport system substrate-binding protein
VSAQGSLRSLLALGLAGPIALAAWGVQAGTAPDVLVKAVSADVVAMLKQDEADGRATDVAQLVEKKILPLFDFERMTRMAVARNWRVASPQQRETLVKEFRTLLVRTYSSSLAGYRDAVIDVKPLRAGAAEGEALVRSTVKQAGGEAMTIDYDMADGPAGWQVYDIKVGGVSLVITYRESFAAAVRDGGIDGLIKTLADKNQRPATPG